MHTPGEYVYGPRPYRLSYEPVVEMYVAASGIWVKLPKHLADQFLEKLETGQAVSNSTD